MADIPTKQETVENMAGLAAAAGALLRGLEQERISTTVAEHVVAMAFQFGYLRAYGGPPPPTAALGQFYDRALPLLERLVEAAEAEMAKGKES